MRHEEFQPRLSNLIGAQVFNKFIVTNSIVLWVNAPVKMPNSKCLWIDPPWRLEDQGSITTTSASFPYDQEDGESEDSFKARFAEICKASDNIENTTIIDITMNPRTSDLTIQFSNGKTLRTFTVWTEEENWFLSDYETKQKFSIATNETTVSSLNA